MVLQGLRAGCLPFLGEGVVQETLHRAPPVRAGRQGAEARRMIGKHVCSDPAQAAHREG